MKIIIALIALLSFHVQAAPELSPQGQHKPHQKSEIFSEQRVDDGDCFDACHNLQCLNVSGTATFEGTVIIGGCTLACTGTTLIVNGSSIGGGISGYGFVYNVSAKKIALEAPILFDTNGPLSGITHTPSTAAINVVNAGIYAIYWSVSGIQPNQFALFVNGTPSASTIYGSGAGNRQNTGLTIVALGAGTVLTLRNHTSPAAVALQTLASGTATNVNAAMLIIKLA